MISDCDWNTFATHIKPKATIRCGIKEGYLLENFPYGQDNDRVDYEKGFAIFFGVKNFNAEGRFLTSHFHDTLRIQLCEDAEETTASPWELEFWVNGDFLDFEQVIALSEVVK